MLWLLIAVAVAAVAVVAWAAWPRPVRGESGRGADESRLTGPARMVSTARVATFNIHGCKGRDGRRDPSRIAGDLKGIDIAALQEVHDTWTSPRQPEKLAGALGMVLLKAPTRRRWFRRHRSNALLTRSSVDAWKRFPLIGHASQRFHFRNLTVARVELRKPLWVLFTHLNRGDGQEEQLEQVMQEFVKHSPAVLMGDFNMIRTNPVLLEYLARDDITDALGEHLDDDNPDRIDWILCRGVTVRRAGVVDSGASDHPLYWCDIEL